VAFRLSVEWWGHRRGGVEGFRGMFAKRAAM
jgi:hypothetical protein